MTKLTKSAGGVVAWARVHGQPALRGWGARDVGSSEGVLETLDVYGEVPAFRLTERSGRPVGRALVEGSSRVMRLRDYSAAVARC